MVARAPEGPFEQALATLSDAQLDEQEHVYEADIARLMVLLGAVRATKEARKTFGGNGASASAPLPRPAAAIDAVLAVMATRPDSEWTSDAILTELKKRDWQPRGRTPKNSVDATLSRMKAEGMVDRPERGIYRLRDADSIAREKLARILTIEDLDRGTRPGDEQ